VRSFFTFCAPGLIFGGTEGVASLFHVLRSRTRFRRCRVRQIPFSCFGRPNSFSAVPRASGLVFIFCAPGLVFGGTKVVRSRFLFLRYQTRLWRYRGRPILFSYFPPPDMFLARASVAFSSFALTDMLLAVTRALSPVFMLCDPGHVFGGAEGVGSLFHVLRSRAHFWRYRGRLVPFSCFALPDSFSDGTVGVGSRFHVLRSRKCFRRYRGRWVPYSCFALPGSFLAVSRSSGPFSCFALPDSFSAVPRA
jgi:hypothetical protein